jgi:hypothetical protein
MSIGLGTRPDGRKIDPFMPFESFAKLNDTEKRALWAYLKSLPARPSESHERGPRERLKLAADLHPIPADCVLRMGDDMRALRLFTVSVLTFALGGCDAIGAIFKAGLWLGVIGILMIVLLVWLVSSRFK